MIEIVGFFAFATNVWGNLLLARKSENGWIVRMVSIVAWFFYALHERNIAAIANSVTFLGINIYGYVKWRRERVDEYGSSGTRSERDQ